MEFGGKKFDYYWKIIQAPFYTLIGWSLIGLIVAFFSYQTYMNIFSSVAGIVLSILIFGFIGWTTIKDYKGEIKQGAWAGALTGVLAGFIGAIIGVVMYYLVPEMTQTAVNQAVSLGAPADTVKAFIEIGMYADLLISPLISGIMGAVISVITALIAKKVK